MVWDSCLWDSGRWDGWGIILGLIPLFFATSGLTKRRKHYFVCYFLNIGLGSKKVNDLLTSPKNQFRDYFIRNRIEKLMPQLWNFPPQTLKISKKTTNPFSNLDFFVKSGFPQIDFPWIVFP